MYLGATIRLIACMIRVARGFLIIAIPPIPPILSDDPGEKIGYRPAYVVSLHSRIFWRHVGISAC